VARSKNQSQPKSVVLVSADGVETEVTSAIAFNNLVYGQGHKPKSGNVTDAYASLVDSTGTDAGQPASTAQKNAGT
jgi:hypothetical protein